MCSGLAGGPKMGEAKREPLAVTNPLDELVSWSRDNDIYGVGEPNGRSTSVPYRMRSSLHPLYRILSGVEQVPDPREVEEAQGVGGQAGVSQAGAERSYRRDIRGG